jgi:phosphate-selective porin OprO/OprP
MKPAAVLAGWMTLCLLLAASVSRADDASYERIWQRAVLYENTDEQAWLRRLALSGRAQGDYAWFDADEGDYDDLRWRRFRFGFISDFAHDIKLQVEGDFDLNNSLGDNYSRLTDAYLGWEWRADHELKLLKHSAGFTLDGYTSSKKLLTPERNNLTNNLWFTAEYFTGASISGKPEKRWSYKAGVFASDDSDELGVDGASYFTLLSTAYDLSPDLGLETATINLDYVYNDRDPAANTRDFSHVVSLSSRWGQGPWGLWTDLSAGDGHYGQSDLWGLVLMPFYNFSKYTQLVARYTRVESDDDNGVRLNRYESSVVSGRGDEYDEYLMGVNLYFYDHRLKWQNGLQYASMEDGADDGGEYDGWGLISGLRVYW